MRKIHSVYKRNAKKPFSRNILIWEKTRQLSLPRGLLENMLRSTCLGRGYQGAHRCFRGSVNSVLPHQNFLCCSQDHWSVNTLMGCFWVTRCRHTDLWGLTWSRGKNKDLKEQMVPSFQETFPGESFWPGIFDYKWVSVATNEKPALCHSIYYRILRPTLRLRKYYSWILKMMLGLWKTHHHHKVRWAEPGMVAHCL